VTLNICVPVLKRYDLLKRMLESLRGSTLPVSCVYIIDNGGDGKALGDAVSTTPVRYRIHVPPDGPYGVAESWNWFLINVDEERVIVNDDILFAKNSLEKLTASNADLIWAKDCGFSCFVLRDACVEKIGFFDEAISPGYGYYEDEDYLQRLDGRGTRPRSADADEVECGVQHLRSQTLAVASPKELADHHRRFKIAQRNYARKWGLEREFEVHA